tara:strand:- start:2403 stop:3587 length:1185 start_codon:yes stop_codon:yes gene_type:complete
MSESTFTIINKNIAAMASAGVPGQQQIDAVLATIDKRLKSIQDNIQPRNFLKKITRPIQNLGKNMFKGFFGGFTIGSLIKQSQVFTATAGSFFQIIGAMIDTILAPLAPSLSKVITASADVGIKAARGVAKISGAVIGPILDQIPKIIEGIAYMVPKTLEFLFNVGKFIKDLISQGSITGVIIFAIRKLWEGLQYAGTKVYEAVLVPLWDKFKAWWNRTLPSAFGGGKEEPIKHAERAMQATQDIADFSTTDYTHKGVTYKATKVKSAFIKEPATAAEKVANLMTGAALVKDIYSGYHRGGEGSFGAGSIFDEKGGGAVGMKQAVRKITDAVNNPSAFKAELAGIVTDKQFKDMMNIAAGQQYADDDITRTKMLAEGSRNKFGFGGGDNFYFPN